MNGYCVIFMMVIHDIKGILQDLLTRSALNFDMIVIHYIGIGLLLYPVKDSIN